MSGREIIGFSILYKDINMNTGNLLGGRILRFILNITVQYYKKMLFKREYLQTLYAKYNMLHYNFSLRF